MTQTTTHTITTTTDIRLAKLIPSPANVRRTGAGVGIEALAASIQAHGLLQSLVVRPALDANGQETDRFEVVAGGRRLAALRLLAQRKRIAKGAAIPCRVLDGTDVDGSEAGLAENVVRHDMHPADQFEAFAALHEGGTGVEDIAARFGVSAHTVRQRLRLAVVASALIQAYRDEVLTLDHLTAFAVTEDYAAQEQVFGQLQDWQRHPDTIRRLLTHALVPASDRKALLVGLDAYVAAGGVVQRDLFSDDRGGWIADPLLLERLVAERMEAAAETIRIEGWRWVAIGSDAQAQAWGWRRVWPGKAALLPEDERRRTELTDRYDELAEEDHGTGDDLPDEVAAELERIEAEQAAFETKQAVFRPEDVAVAGVVITVTADGTLRSERGFVRPEDEARPEPVTSGAEHSELDETEQAGADEDAGDRPVGNVTPIRDEAEPKATVPALSAPLLAELEAHRTAGLQAAVAKQPELALRLQLHGLVTDAFYSRYGETVASLHAYPPALAAACPGIADTPARQAMAEAEAAWRGRLPQNHGGLWEWLQEQDTPTLLGLLAVCVARTVNAGGRPWTTPEGSRCIAAQVASAAGLDMRRCWTPTKESYFDRVPKALILDAVREGVGADAAGRIAGLKKDGMVVQAAQLLDGTGWLPATLWVPAATQPVGSTDTLTILPMPMAAE